MSKAIEILRKQPSDFEVILQHYRSKEGNKPVLTESQVKRMYRINLTDSLLRIHMEKDVVKEFLKVKLNCKDTVAKELVREAIALLGATTTIDKTGERILMLEQLNKAMQINFDERDWDAYGKNFDRKAKLLQLDKDDPSEDVIAMAEPHILVVTSDPKDRFGPKITDEQLINLAEKFDIEASEFISYDEID